MKRLTFEGLFCDIAMCRENPCPYDGMCSQRKTWERLKEYEDAEQAGRLVVLPCKFGDPLYRIRRFKRGKNWTKEAAHIMSTTMTMNNVADILFGGVMGKTVFLTREEAEAALKGGEG